MFSPSFKASCSSPLISAVEAPAMPLRSASPSCPFAPASYKDLPSMTPAMESIKSGPCAACRDSPKPLIASPAPDNIAARPPAPSPALDSSMVRAESWAWRLVTVSLSPSMMAVSSAIVADILPRASLSPSTSAVESAEDVPSWLKASSTAVRSPALDPTAANFSIKPSRAAPTSSRVAIASPASIPNVQIVSSAITLFSDQPDRLTCVLFRLLHIVDCRRCIHGISLIVPRFVVLFPFFLCYQFRLSNESKEPLIPHLIEILNCDPALVEPQDSCLKRRWIIGLSEIIGSSQLFLDHRCLRPELPCCFRVSFFDRLRCLQCHVQVFKVPIAVRVNDHPFDWLGGPSFAFVVLPPCETLLFKRRLLKKKRVNNVTMVSPCTVS